MSVKLHMQEEMPGIPAYDMKDGQIGVIVNWPRAEYVGKVVQRYGDLLIELGRLAHNGCVDSVKSNKPDCRVRLLRPGELIEIVDNC